MYTFLQIWLPSVVNWENNYWLVLQSWYRLNFSLQREVKTLEWLSLYCQSPIALTNDADRLQIASYFCTAVAAVVTGVKVRKHSQSTEVVHVHQEPTIVD